MLPFLAKVWRDDISRATYLITKHAIRNSKNVTQHAKHPPKAQLWFRTATLHAALKRQHKIFTDFAAHNVVFRYLRLSRAKAIKYKAIIKS